MGLFILFLIFFCVIGLLLPMLWLQFLKTLPLLGLSRVVKHKWRFNFYAYFLPIAALMCLTYFGVLSLKNTYMNPDISQYYFAAILNPFESLISPVTVNLFEFSGPLFTNTGLHKLFGLYLLTIASVFILPYMTKRWDAASQIKQKKIQPLQWVTALLFWMLEVVIAYITLALSIGVIVLTISPVTSFLLLALLFLLILMIGTACVVFVAWE